MDREGASTSGIDCHNEAKDKEPFTFPTLTTNVYLGRSLCPHNHTGGGILDEDGLLGRLLLE